MTADLSMIGTIDVIYRAAAQGTRCWVRNDRGQVRELPMARFMGSSEIAASDRIVDEHVIACCSQHPTLDLGCGPGRFTASLHHRGSPALGVDMSVAAIELTRSRGGAAICTDLFGPLPAERCWQQVLLVDGNIGIGGNPVRVLQRAAEMLAPQGIVIVEVDPRPLAVSHEMLRWETTDHTSPWFRWSRVGAGALGTVADAAGLLVTDVRRIHSRMIAVLAAVGSTVKH